MIPRLLAGKRALPAPSRRPRLSAALLVVALMLIAGAVDSTGWAQIESEQALERRVKAAFLYRFTEFITWPSLPSVTGDGSFVIAVIGSNDLVNELRQVIDGRTVQGKPVKIRHVNDLDALADENIIFISNAEKHRLPQISKAAPRGALIVTESNGALAQGSIINFVLADGRVRFEISLNAAERQGLRLSSRLLAVALAVRTASP